VAKGEAAYQIEASRINSIKRRFQTPQAKPRSLFLQREQQRAEMAAANAMQARLKEERRVREAAEEEAFRQRMLAKFAEDDRVEQMNAARKRMKLEEHKREVERLWRLKEELYQKQVRGEKGF
jgi:hypothetical protein